MIQKMLFWKEEIFGAFILLFLLGGLMRKIFKYLKRAGFLKLEEKLQEEQKKKEDKKKKRKILRRMLILNHQINHKENILKRRKR